MTERSFARIVILRHAPKLYANGRGLPLFDPPLEPIAPCHVNVACERLHAVLPPAHRVFASPYLRARQTAELVSRVGMITCDTRLSEMLGAHHVQTTHLSQWHASTLCAERPIPPGEMASDMHRRIASFADDLFRNPSATLVVTHGFCVQSLLRETLYRFPHLRTELRPDFYPDQFSGFVIDFDAGTVCAISLA